MVEKDLNVSKETNDEEVDEENADQNNDVPQEDEEGMGLCSLFQICLYFILLIFFKLQTSHRTELLRNQLLARIWLILFRHKILTQLFLRTDLKDLISYSNKRKFFLIS
jgi:hypothetical protein